jgi:metallo-beta-lactamase class B
MISTIFKALLSLFMVLLSTVTVNAQVVQEPTQIPKNWNMPYQPFRIAGNLYYVGTYELASYLIITSAGNILINTGLAASKKQIQNNIKALGFRFADIKILLNTQAHYDHMGAMAAIKKKTRAILMIDEKDAAVAEDGGRSDYALGKDTSTFKPVKPNRLLQDGDTITLGNMQLQMLHHPGHTKGSCSFVFTVKDDKQSYKVLIANLPTIVTDKSFTSLATYPDIAKDYAYTLHAMKNISFDIWLASHASQFNLHTKRKPSDDYNPNAFADQAGYDEALADLQKDYDEKLKQQ